MTLTQVEMLANGRRCSGGNVGPHAHYLFLISRTPSTFSYRNRPGCALLLSGAAIYFKSFFAISFFGTTTTSLVPSRLRSGVFEAILSRAQSIFSFTYFLLHLLCAFREL